MPSLQAVRALLRIFATLAVLFVAARVDAQPRRTKPAPAAPAPEPAVTVSSDARTLLIKSAARSRASGLMRAALEDYRAACKIAKSSACVEGIAATSATIGNYPDAVSAYEELSNMDSAAPALRESARGRVAELERRVGTIKIVVPDSASEVSVDGAAVGAGPLSTTVRVLPGSHTITATRPSKSTLTRTVKLDVGRTETVELSDSSSPPVPPTVLKPTTEPPKQQKIVVAGTLPPPGSKSYRPVRTTSTVRIDGVLDDEVWSRAPVDSSFVSILSKPFGLPAKNKTEVMLAYDERFLYVAFRCFYSGPGIRDDSLPLDEDSALANAETVGIHIDGRNDKSSSRFFAVTRTAARIDEDRVYNSSNTNLEWRGVWDVATQHSDEQWTAEFAIPWGTAAAAQHEGDFTVGVNFERSLPGDEYDAMVWDAPPPGSAASMPPSLFGHLVGLHNISPNQQLFLQPYVGVAARHVTKAAIRTGAAGGEALPVLRDFSATDGNVSTYAGLYARFRPSAPVSLDIAINPDFSQTTPDAALTNSDRFELFRPELRPFFAEDRGRFELGPDDAQLFYTRRIGLQTDANGISHEVPIIYGAKAIAHAGPTEVALLNVETSSLKKGIEFSDNVTVVKANHLFDDGNRLGNLFMRRRGADGKEHRVAGIEGTATAYDQHLSVYGFLARSTTEASTTDSPTAFCGPITGLQDRQCSGTVGGTRVEWQSNEFYADGSYTEVSKDYDPQLGYLPVSTVADGARLSSFAAGYRPFVKSDLVQRARLNAVLSHATDPRDNLVYERASLGLGASMLNDTTILVTASSSRDVLPKKRGFVGGDASRNIPQEINVPAGEYQTLNFTGTVQTPPRRTIEGTLRYREGGFFGGYQRVPTATVGLNLGRFSQTTTYSYYIVRGIGGERAKAHALSYAAQFAYAPLARSVLVIEANSFDPYAALQLTNSYQFGQLSSISLVLSRRGQSVEYWFDAPEDRILLSFVYGFSPF